MGKKSAPPAPDYTQAAEKTAQSSKEVTNMQTWANRPTINTPWGTQTWNTAATVDPATGQPVTEWTQNTYLSPQQQAALDSQMAIDMGRSQGAQTLLGQAVSGFQKPMDLSGVTPYFQFGPGSSGEDMTNRIMEATWAAQKPQLDQRRSDTEEQLANMGVTRGSEAFNREQARLSQAENAARLGAYQTGFGTTMQMGEFAARQRQQQIAEMLQGRGQTLNELNALLTGSQVSMPTMPGFSQAQRSAGVDYSGAARDQYSASMDAFNAKQQGMNSTMSGIGSIAGMAGMFMMSDARVKTILQPLGRLKNGLRVWLYWHRVYERLEAGLMAQDVLRIRPHAVRQRPDGLLEVCYALAVR